MAQGTLYVTDANAARQGLEQTVLASGNLVPNVVVTDADGNRVRSDAQGNLGVQRGGRLATLNLSAPVAIKASAGRLRRIVIIAPGSASAAFTFNDCATTGAASAANTIYTLPYDATMLEAGLVIDLDWPCATGIVLSAVPGSGSPIVAVTYD